MDVEDIELWHIVVLGLAVLVLASLSAFVLDVGNSLWDGILGWFR